VKATLYLLSRAVSTAVVLVGVSILTFLLVHATPGDPARTILRQRLDRDPSPEAVASFRAEQGLDEPIYIHYGTWLTDVLRGDLGESYYTGRSVTDLLISHLPATFELAVASLVIALLIAIPAGVISSVHHGKWVDIGSQLGALLGVSMPNFWLGYLLILVFSVRFGLFPVTGVGGVPHLILPAIALGTGMAAIITRLVRSSMLEVLDREYLDTARAKGLREQIVIYKHALRNALIPVVTVAGLQLGFVLNGAVVIEIVFQRPGLGMLLVDSIYDRDYPIVQGVVLVCAVSFVLTNFLVDLTYEYLDPRIRLGGGST